MKIKKAAVCAALAAGVLIGAAICASAADYSFDGAEAREFYPSTRYESVYGAEYNYGGMNAAEEEVSTMQFSKLRSSGTATSCMRQPPRCAATTVRRGKSSRIRRIFSGCE